MRVGIERSPRRQGLPRAQSKFLALTKQNGAPKNLLDCFWEGRIEGPENVDFLDGDDGDRRLGPPSGRLYG